MKLFNRFIRYLNPSVDSKVLQDMDRRTLRCIHIISSVVLLFESALFFYIAFDILSNLQGFDRGDITSLVSVGYCVVLCAVASFLANRMLSAAEFSHTSFTVFRIFFFILFSVWAVFVDYRHYKTGDQILTFYTVSLIMVCFVLFRPWIGTLLIGGSFACLYISLYTLDGASGVNVLNYLVFALASIVANGILYHAQISVSKKSIRLIESNETLRNASHHDGLTGLLNRLALEEHAHRADGRKMTAYMADINYFKEINDRHGHAAGDAILKEVSETLKQLYPGAHYYRYGGDEFLVITYKPPEENFGASVYDFMKGQIKVLLSIGSAQGEPAGYQEFFDLISEADKALYVTKKRTHSSEFGGHDRRKNR